MKREKLKAIAKAVWVFWRAFLCRKEDQNEGKDNKQGTSALLKK
jgi:hypothetical protein